MRFKWHIKGVVMSKHTAGPWSTGFGYRPQINSADGRCVAWAETLGDISHTSEEHANAALIASAPELLEACQFVLQEWNEPEAVPEALDRLRKAIAKAEGK